MMVQSSLLTLTLNICVGIAAAQSVVSIGFPACDVLINAGLERILTFPADSAYNESVSTYYAADNRLLRPFCIVQPRSTEDVSSALKLLSTVKGAGSWAVAIRSGGHSDWNNNAAHRGVTIDLSFLNSTTLIGPAGKWTGKSEITNSIAQIQPGARWGNVYTDLEPSNLRVTGGRSGHVGVGGLLLSGGASYDIQQWGLSCNNVLNYEVVLANGSIISANGATNQDMFKALKGGGNNLGIVTRFDMRTFTIPPGGAYGDFPVAAWDQLEKINEIFLAYVADCSGKSDQFCMIYRADAPGREKAISSLVVSTDGSTDSTAFAGLKNVTFQKDTRKRQPITAIANKLADQGGLSYMSFALTLQSRGEVVRKAAEIFSSLTTELHGKAVPVGLHFIFQPLPKGTSPSMNILGLERSNPKDSILFEARATLKPTDTAMFEGIVRNAVAKATEELKDFAKTMEGFCEYVYMNYAGAEQDVLASYGMENVRFLEDVAKRYDSGGFFQYRVTGGWKVSRVGELDGGPI